MKSKRLSIALCILGSSLAVVIASIALIWATVTIGVNASINVTYTVTDVIVDVSANKYFVSNTAIPFTGGNNGVVSFDVTSASAPQVLTTNATSLTSINDYVVYEYKFVNNGENGILANLTTGNATNITWYVSPPSATRKTNIYTTFAPSNYTTGNSISNAPISGNSTTYAYIAMKITNITQHSSFSGTFAWTLANDA